MSFSDCPSLELPSELVIKREFRSWLVSFISLVISALAWNPKTSGFELIGNFLIANNII